MRLRKSTYLHIKVVVLCFLSIKICSLVIYKMYLHYEIMHSHADTCAYTHPHAHINLACLHTPQYLIWRHATRDPCLGILISSLSVIVIMICILLADSHALLILHNQSMRTWHDHMILSCYPITMPSSCKYDLLLKLQNYHFSCISTLFSNVIILNHNSSI